MQRVSGQDDDQKLLTYPFDRFGERRRHFQWYLFSHYRAEVLILSHDTSILTFFSMIRLPSLLTQDLNHARGQEPCLELDALECSKGNFSFPFPHFWIAVFLPHHESLFPFPEGIFFLELVSPFGAGSALFDAAFFFLSPSSFSSSLLSPSVL